MSADWDAWTNMLTNILMYLSCLTGSSIQCSVKHPHRSQARETGRDAGGLGRQQRLHLHCGRACQQEPTVMEQQAGEDGLQLVRLFYWTMQWRDVRSDFVKKCQIFCGKPISAFSQILT